MRRMLLEKGLPHEDLGQRLVIYSSDGEARSIAS
jgi:hypothetical protein